MPPDYVITISQKQPAADAAPLVTERLVRAKNEARAISFVVSDTVAVDRATTDDVIRLTQAGVTLEAAE